MSRWLTLGYLVWLRVDLVICRGREGCLWQGSASDRALAEIYYFHRRPQTLSFSSFSSRTLSLIFSFLSQISPPLYTSWVSCVPEIYSFRWWPQTLQFPPSFCPPSHFLILPSSNWYLCMSKSPILWTQIKIKDQFFTAVPNPPFPPSSWLPFSSFISPSHIHLFFSCSPSLSTSLPSPTLEWKCVGNLLLEW